jgi:hypothetical protein
MNSLTPDTLQLVMALGAFFLGTLTFITGVLILVTNTLRKDLRELSQQSARLAGKGLAEELSGLVGNASTLIAAVNDLVRTAAGIGIFLTELGLALMSIAAWLVFQMP